MGARDRPSRRIRVNTGTSQVSAVRCVVRVAARWHPRRSATVAEPLHPSGRSATPRPAPAGGPQACCVTVASLPGPDPMGVSRGARADWPQHLNIAGLRGAMCNARYGRRLFAQVPLECRCSRRWLGPVTNPLQAGRHSRGDRGPGPGGQARLPWGGRSQDRWALATTRYRAGQRGCCGSGR